MTVGRALGAAGGAAPPQQHRTRPRASSPSCGLPCHLCVMACLYARAAAGHSAPGCSRRLRLHPGAVEPHGAAGACSMHGGEPCPRARCTGCTRHVPVSPCTAPQAFSVMYLPAVYIEEQAVHVGFHERSWSRQTENGSGYERQAPRHLPLCCRYMHWCYTEKAPNAWHYCN